MPDHVDVAKNVPGEGLSRKGLEALLTRLDSDRDQAAERYRQLHLKISRLYEWRGCPSPDELADETLDRVASKLEAGVEIHSPESYITRVAYFVFRELVRREQRRRTALKAVENEPRPNPEEPLQEGERRRCFHQCLGGVEPTERQHLMRYYEGDKSVKIENRRQLAADLGVAAGTLRIRMHRIRQRLEKCIRDCLERHSGETDRSATPLESGSRARRHGGTSRPQS